VVDEAEVEIVGEGVGPDDLVAFYVRAAAPAAPLRITGGVERTVIIIHELVEPRIGFEALIAIVQLPLTFLARFAEGHTRAPALVDVTGRRRVVHELTGNLDRELPRIERSAREFVSGRAGADNRIE